MKPVRNWWGSLAALSLLPFGTIGMGEYISWASMCTVGGVLDAPL